MKPILFNTEMVKAIQEGRKTATRRVIRWERDNVIKAAAAKGKLYDPIQEGEPIPETLLCWYMDQCLPRPYAVGDELWVRETWAFWPCVTCGEPCVNSGNDSNPMYGKAPETMETADGLTEGCFLYRADGEEPVFSGGHIWRPSIHMPKQAARIFLRVTEVFPERLRESFDGASLPMRELAAEGIPIYEDCKRCLQRDRRDGACLICGKYDQPRREFSRLWDGTIRKDRLAAEGWEGNPWVWVVRFERCERPAGWPWCGERS